MSGLRSFENSGELTTAWTKSAIVMIAASILVSVGNRQALGQGTATAIVDAHPLANDKRVKRDDEFYEPEPLDFNDHTGYVQIFDGTTLRNWDGDPAIWRVEDGAIVGESTKERPVADSFLSFRGFEVKDFDLKLELKVEKGGGSGIQYRSKTGLPWVPRLGQVNPNLNWMMTGPQADFWFPVSPENAEWTGQFYSENTPLGIVAWRGQVVESASHAYP